MHSSNLRFECRVLPCCQASASSLPRRSAWRLLIVPQEDDEGESGGEDSDREEGAGAGEGEDGAGAPPTKLVTEQLELAVRAAVRCAAWVPLLAAPHTAAAVRPRASAPCAISTRRAAASLHIVESPGEQRAAGVLACWVAPPPPPPTTQVLQLRGPGGRAHPAQGGGRHCAAGAGGAARQRGGAPRAGGLCRPRAAGLPHHSAHARCAYSGPTTPPVPHGPPASRA